MRDMKLFLELAVKGEARFRSAMKGMAGATNDATKQMTNSWAGLDRRMSGVSSSMAKVAALVGGGALFRQAVIDVTNFERSLTETRLTGELTAKELENIRKRIMDLSAETLQLPEAQLEAFKDMVAAGIDPRLILGGLKAIDRTATATFSDVKDIAKTTVDLFQKMDIKPEKLERAFNILHKAGKTGRFELKDMARYFPEVLASASQYGLTGERGTAQVAAMLQIARRNRGEASEAATDMKSFFSHLVSYRKQFGRAGLNVFDFIDLKSGKFKAGKDIDAFFEELRRKTKGGSAASLKAIGIEDYETSNFMAGIMKDWEDYKKIRDEAQGAAGQDVVEKDFNEVMNTDWARLKKLEVERSKAMKSAASSDAAHKALGLSNWALENPVTAGATALGTYATWKMVQRYLGNKAFGNIGASIPGGGAGVPVTVTNWPSGFQGTGIQPPTPGGPANRQGALKKIPWFAGSIGALPAAGTAAVGYTSIEIGKYLAEREARTSSTKRLLELRSQHMVMGGGPNSYQVQLLNQELARRNVNPNKPEVQNDINLNIQIDGQGRTFVVSDDMRTRTRINIKRGNFFGTETSYMPSH